MSFKAIHQAGFRQKEVRLALDTAMDQPEGEIFIIPARLEECDTLESLRKWHWVDLFEDDGYEYFMRALRRRDEKIGAALQVRRNWLPNITTSHNTKQKSVLNKKPNEETKLNPSQSKNITADKDENWKPVFDDEWQPSFEDVESIQKTDQEKIKQKRTEHPAARKGELQKFPTNLKPFLGIAGIVGAIIVLFWAGSWVIRKLDSLMPTTRASMTLIVSTKTAFTQTLVFPKGTPVPSTPTAKAQLITPEPTIPPEIMAGTWQSPTGMQYTIGWINGGYEVTLITHPTLGKVEIMSQLWQNGVLNWQYELTPGHMSTWSRIRTNYIDNNRLYVSMLVNENASNYVSLVLTRIH